MTAKLSDCKVFEPETTRWGSQYSVKAEFTSSHAKANLEACIDNLYYTCGRYNEMKLRQEASVMPKMYGSNTMYLKSKKEVEVVKLVDGEEVEATEEDLTDGVEAKIELVLCAWDRGDSCGVSAFFGKIVIL